MKQLGFQKREVHVRRAFHGTSFAGKAVAEGCFHFGGAQRVAGGNSAHFKRGADGGGASARGHNLIAGRDKSRTHRRRFFATTATTVALFEVACKRTVLGGKGQHRCERETQSVPGAEPQVFVDVK